MRTAREHFRNTTLNRSAFRLGQLVAEGLLDESAVAAELLGAALEAGLEERETRRTIRSGLGAGMRHPRSPAPAIAGSLTR